MEEATLARGHERNITYLPIHVRNGVTETAPSMVTAGSETIGRSAGRRGYDIVEGGGG